MSKALDFRDNYYLIGTNIIHVGDGYLQVPIGNDKDIEVPTGKIRFNKYRNTYNMGLNHDWMVLSNLPDTATFIVRGGDSMFGDLRFTNNAKVLNSDGVNNEPSYSFLDDEDTGIFSPYNDAISVVVGGAINPIEVIKVERVGSGDQDSNIYFEGDVYVDELTFTRRGGLKLDGDYAYFTGNIGLRLPSGNTADRPLEETALIRYNEALDVYDIGFNVAANAINHVDSGKWGNLSLVKDKSSWFVRSGDSVYGDIQLTNNARVLLTDGTATQPSIAFDSIASTGFYKHSNGIGLVVDSTSNAVPVVTVERVGSGVLDNVMVVNADLNVEEISFDSLVLDGNIVTHDGTGGFVLAKGTTAQRISEVGIVRYNTETTDVEIKTANRWLIASEKQDNDTWFHREGDSIFGDLRVTNNAVIKNSNGSLTHPSYTFLADTDSGLLSLGADKIGLVVGGSINAVPSILIERNTSGSVSTVTINGDLIVRGAQTIINTTELTIDDNKITLNKNGSSALSAGIEIENGGAVASTIQYVFSSSNWTIDNKRLSLVAAPTEVLDATNKKYVDDHIAATRLYAEQLVDAERIRATNEEVRIDQRLTSEALRIDTRIDNTNTALNNEITRATNEEIRIDSRLTTEISRVEGLLSNEVTRATNEEARIEGLVSNNTTRINNEVTRATNEETRIEGLVSNNTTRINNEVTRATNEETRIENLANTLNTATRQQFGINKFVFTTTISANDSYEIPRTSTNNFDLLDAYVDVKVVDTYVGSNTYGKYINGNVAVTVSYETARIMVYNELDDRDIELRIVVWVR